MFGLFKKKEIEHADLSGLVTDMHNHLIPGIDDGATDLESSIVMIRAMYDLGYRKFVATPHVQWEMYKNTHEIIENGAQLVRDRLAELEMKVEFRGAAEYFLDEHVEELIEKNIPLLTIHKNMVLVEFSFIRQPMDLKEKLISAPDKGVPANHRPSGTLFILWRPQKYLRRIARYGLHIPVKSVIALRLLWEKAGRACPISHQKEICKSFRFRSPQHAAHQYSACLFFHYQYC